MQRSNPEEQILIVSHRVNLHSVAFKCSWEWQSEICKKIKVKKLKVVESNLSVKWVLVQALKRIDK